ncbi:MAG: M48 family metallopeptidase [Planctomycetes bacterium]|nr:M48 family metallopeptidase [Planctomycetota bacterium]
MPNLLRPLFVLLLALLPAACANLNIYPDDELEPLSVQAYEEATKETKGIVTGTTQADMVQRVAQRIAATTGETSFHWEARLLRADDVPNAFCLPNGRIAVYTGILKPGLADTEDKLAVVMGHEVAHAILRHGGKRMTQGTLTNAGLAAVQAGLGLSQMSNEAKGGIMAALGLGAQYGVLLPYSRDHESEADVEGLRYAIRAGYDPNAAPTLWEGMARLGGNSTPEWLSTHPASEARAQKLREMIPKLLEEEKGWRPAPAPTTGGTKTVNPDKLPPKK